MQATNLTTAQTGQHSDAELAVINKDGVSICVFNGFDDEGHFLVLLKERSEPIKALSTVGLSVDDIGANVVISFENGNVRRPIIIGRLQANETSHTSKFKVDGERIVLHAEREIELRCGDASIRLTRAGKVLIRGEYVLTRSRGANKIKGAYVDIN